MVQLFYSNKYGMTVWGIFVWNWKTGKLVRFRDLIDDTLLNLPQLLVLSSKDGSGLTNVDTLAIFLDESHVVVIPNRSAITELAMFNTLVPQHRPGYMRRLDFPLEFCNKRVMHVNLDRDLGTPNMLLPDPAQAVLVLDLGRDQEHYILLVVRTQALIEQVHSVRADIRVPWDEWGTDTVSIRVQNSHRLFTFVHGAQVMVAWPFLGSLRGLRSYRIRTFDFSQRGRGSLPFRDGADGTGRRLLFEDGEYLRFESDETIDLWDELQSLGDGSLIRLVSCHPLAKSGADATVSRGIQWARITLSRFGNCVENAVCNYILFICHERIVAATVPYK